MGWPSRASHTLSTEQWSMRSANGPLKAAGMCCAMTMPGTSEGRWVRTSLMASVPPVDAPMAMIRSVVAKCVGALRLGSTTPASWRSATFIAEASTNGRTWARAAILTLAMISCADSLMPCATSTVGLATKSTAPRARASSATAAPFCVSEEHMTTGMGRSRIRLRRNARPSMRGISTSRVSTSGFSNLILSRATYGSGAVPTTSMSGSEFKISVSSWRMTAESSTTKTWIFLVIGMASGLEQFHGSGFDLGGRRIVENLTRETAAEILGGDEEALGLQIVAHELRIARAHVERHIEHLAAADHLELEIRPLAAECHDVVDQPLHRNVAVARRGADQIFRPGAGAARSVERQHEVIHSADSHPSLTHACRDAGAEHGEDRLVVLRDVVIAGQELRDVQTQILVPNSADVSEMG